MTTPRKHARRGESPNETILTVQDAVYETVHNTAGVHAKALADGMRLSHRDLLDIADPYRKRKLRAEEIAPLINTTFLLSGARCYLVLDVIERQVGRVAFPIPSGQALDHEIANAVSEFGEYLQESAKAAADIRITEDEAQKVTLDGEKAIAAIAEHVANVRHRAGLTDVIAKPSLLRSVAK